MDIERALLSKCVASELIETIVARGIAPRHFEDEQNRQVFITIINHMSRYGAPPSMSAVMAAHPFYRFDVETNAIEYLIDKFVEKVQKREAERSVLDIADQIRNNPQVDVDSLFMEHAERVAQAVPSSRISRLSEVPQRIDLYGELMRTGRIPGLTFGIETIDHIVLGVQGHEMVVVSAPSSWGKSTYLQYVCFCNYLAGLSPNDNYVFISLEMDAQALLRKFDTMATNFEYTALRALELGEGDMQKWEEWGERASKAPNDIIILDDISDCTVERVFAETLRWKPKGMFVDYFGIMTPSRIGDQDYQGMAQMAKALKRIPRTTGVPLFTAAQTNRSGFKDGVRAENVADTIEIFRSADIMIGLERDEENKPHEMVVKLIKNRDGAKGQATMIWDMPHMKFRERAQFGGGLAEGRAPMLPAAPPVMPALPPAPTTLPAGLAPHQHEQMMHNNPFFQLAIGAQVG